MNRDQLRKLATLIETTIPLDATDDRPGAVLRPFELATHMLRTTTTKLHDGKPHTRTVEDQLPETTRFWNGPDARLTAHAGRLRGRVLLTAAGIAIWHLAGTPPPGAEARWARANVDSVASTLLGLDTWPEAARSLFAPTDWEVFGKDDARASPHAPQPYRGATPSQAARAVRRLADTRTDQTSGPTGLATHLWNWTASR